MNFTCMKLKRAANLTCDELFENLEKMKASMAMKRPKLDETKIQIQYDFGKEERSIVNGANEFNVLQKRFADLRVKYQKNIDELHNLFMEASCDIERLESFLEGKLKTECHMWTYLEDIALNKPTDSIEYKHLLDTKGSPEIEKRLAFLQLFE